MASNSYLLEACRKNRYPVEYNQNIDGSIDHGTCVVSFPCKVPLGTPVEENYTFVEQLDMVRRMQREWSDNSVSCTVYYKKDDIPAIKQYLKNHFTNEMKTVSFLLSSGASGFKQAPYETITEEHYFELVKDIVPINEVSVNMDEMEIQDCAGGSCPVR